MVHQIRAGDKHRFVDISIVSVGDRLFVRQYKFSQRSWYHAFLKDSAGEIKFGEFDPIKIEGRIPQDLDEITRSVTKAYWKKYHIIYAIMRLSYSKKQHEASTLELIPQL